MNTMISYDEYRRRAQEGNVIPLFDEQLADTETPVSVYRKVRDESPYSFLLESVEGGEHIGRYSFIGFNPFGNFVIRGGSYTVQSRHPDVTVMPDLVKGITHPVQALKTLFAHYRTVPMEGLPRLASGAIGYFGYETVQLIENVPSAPSDELGIDDGFLMFLDTLYVFDNVKRKLLLVSNAYVPAGSSEEYLRSEYEKAAGEIGRMREILRKPVPSEGDATRLGPLEQPTTREQYEAMVRRSLSYIVEGDVFQVLPSHRIRRKFEGDPFQVYRMLRLINPSPYMYYFSLNGLAIAGSSPELLVRVENDTVETRPIAGTRKRGSTPAEDDAFAADLLNDQKEVAEHLMLIDLGRNDIGRISEYGKVEVDEYMVIERYSHVMHIVSNVRGTLRKGMTALDAFFSCFPAGTLTGAPKIRAMEIIAGMEPVKRGIYGGAIGYLDFSGNLDTCIAIRTTVIKDGYAYFQAGAGIVYDSVPSREYQETLDKMSAVIRAVEMTQTMAGGPT
ncbi:MAG: anthranilate synthase component I [Bacteroidetes bacterium]|nr:MAG: anthranilate synthase component I [Bacteroidota bacterium]